MKLISTLTILAPPFPGHTRPTPAHADDSIDAATMQISPDDSRPAGAGPAETFTGDVTVKPLFDPDNVRRSVRPRCHSLRVRVRRGTPTPAGKP